MIDALPYSGQRTYGVSVLTGPAELSVIWLSPTNFTVNCRSEPMTPVEHAAIKWILAPSSFIDLILHY